MTIVALHGLLDSPRGFEDLSKYLDLEAPRIPQNRTTLQGRVLWLEEWIQKEKIKNYHLLGHSLGGALAAAASEKLQPQSLLLLAPVGFGSVPMARILRGPLRSGLHHSAPTLLRSGPLVRGTYRFLFTAGHHLPDYLQREIQADPRSILRRAEREMEIVARLDRNPLKDIDYKGPVGALWGAEDKLVPWRDGQDVLRVFPEARLERLPNLGHDLLREDPALVGGWIESFLEKRG